ncbi:MAG: histidine kinase [Bacteroidales bacterium]
MVRKTCIALKKIIPVLVLVLHAISASGFEAIACPPYEFNDIHGKSVSPIDTAKINYYIRHGFTLMSKSDTKPDLVKSYIDSALAVCDKSKIEIPASLHLLNGEFSFTTGDFTQSEEEMKLAVEKAEIDMDYMILVKSLLFEGKYYLRTGFFQESRDAYVRSINISKEQKLRGLIPWAYEGIANVMNNAGDIKGYRDNLKLMIRESFSEKDTLTAVSGLLRLGNSYAGTERNPHLADSVLKRCLELSVKIGDAYHSGFSCANLGWNFYCDKLYDSSLYYYKKSLQYSQQGNFEGITDNSLGNLGTIYRDLGDYDGATKFYTKSIEQARIIKDYYTLSWVSEDMSNLYLRKKDTANAYLQYVLFKKYDDTLQLRKSNQGLLDARIRYEADSHKKEVALLSLRLKNNRLLNIGFAGLMILIGIIAVLIIRGAKNEEKRRLSELNRKISEMTQANLRQQMNPHFIFNTLNSIQYYMFHNDKLATNNYLTKFSSLMRKVLENSQHTSVSLRDELDALNLYLELECLRFKDKFDYVLTVDEEIDPLLYKVPTMLIQPYVENSICHGLMHLEGKGTVKINIRLGKGILICTIEDNGIGREAAREKEKANGNHNSLGTRITNSRIDLVNSLYGTSLKTVYTDLKNENGEPVGTLVEIQIPIIT